MFASTDHYEGGDQDQEDVEFDDYFNDCKMVEEGAVENQAANLSDKKVDPRTLIVGEALKDQCNCNVGQLVVKYEMEDDGEDAKAGMRSATGVVIKELGDDRYVLMTSCYPFITSENGAADITDGQFFLQRSDAKKFAARFTLEAESARPYSEFVLSESFPAEGKDIALCVIKFVSGDQDALDDIVQLKSCSIDDFSNNNEFYVGGYPHQAIKPNIGMSPSRYSHYSMTGKIQDVKEMDGDSHGILLHSTDCSPGQNGAPLYVTNGDGNKFIGAIHSGVNHFSQTNAQAGEDDYYTATIITQHLYESFILPTITEY